jgi:3-methyladenine DNA glycosylase/8-oxoguanine DNA glycosylase
MPHPNPFKQDYDALSAYDDAGVQFLYREVGPPQQKLPNSASLDEAILRIVVGQMLSNRAAATIFQRLIAHFKTFDAVYDALLQLESPGPFMGLSTGKVRTLRYWSESPLRVSGIPQGIDYDALCMLFKGIPGFGPWSIDMLAIFYLTLRDVWPKGDLIVRRVGEALWGGKHPPVAKQHLTVLALMCWEAVRLNVDLPASKNLGV